METSNTTDLTTDTSVLNYSQHRLSTETSSFLSYFSDMEGVFPEEIIVETMLYMSLLEVLRLCACPTSKYHHLLSDRKFLRKRVEMRLDLDNLDSIIDNLDEYVLHNDKYHI